MHNFVKSLYELKGSNQAFNSLSNSYTFGFEYEAISRSDKSQLISLINKYFTDGELKNDDSINNYNNDYPFEYASPILSFNKENIIKIINFLKDSWNIGVYTNNSCGFHIHISFPQYNNDDGKWFLCNLAFDNEIQEKISKFNNIDFFNKKYADKDYLNDIKNHIQNNENPNIDDEKYRLIRLHPQGTLEWRGPRDFMNTQNITNIFKFFKLLGELIGYIDNIMNSENTKYLNKNKIMELFKKPNIEYYHNGNKKSEIHSLNGKYHNPNGPAIIQYYENGNKKSEKYYNNDLLYNDKGPASISYYNNGKVKSKAYYLNDLLHNDKGPALVKYYKNNKMESEEYYINGELHNDNGPAIIGYYIDGKVDYEIYYLNDIKLSKEEWELKRSNNA